MTTFLRERAHICGTSIAFRDSRASGKPIVLLHGNSASSEVWSPLFEGPLAKRWRLLAFDLPGCGDSGQLERYSIRVLADAIVAFARETGSEDGLFVGHSLGGHLLLEAAPRLVRARGFAILGAPPLGKPPQIEQAFHPTPALGFGMKADLSDDEASTWIRLLAGPEHPAAAALVALMRRTDPRLRGGLQESFGALAYSDEVEIVRTLAKPIAVLHGALDAVVNPSYIEGLCIPTLWRGAIQSIAGGSHYAQLDRPEEVGRLLGELAEALEGSQSGTQSATTRLLE